MRRLQRARGQSFCSAPPPFPSHSPAQHLRASAPPLPSLRPGNRYMTRPAGAVAQGLASPLVSGADTAVAVISQVRIDPVSPLCSTPSFFPLPPCRTPDLTRLGHTHFPDSRPEPYSRPLHCPVLIHFCRFKCCVSQYRAPDAN